MYMGRNRSDANVPVICPQIVWTASWLIIRETLRVRKQHSSIYKV